MQAQMEVGLNFLLSSFKRMCIVEVESLKWNDLPA